MAIHPIRPIQPAPPTFETPRVRIPDSTVAALTRDAAMEIYWHEWWLRFGFAQLPAWIAAKTFDLAVNIGAGHAIECLQRALRACGRPVAEDGVIGAVTAAQSRARRSGRADAGVALGAGGVLPAGRGESESRGPRHRQRVPQRMADPCLLVRIVALFQSAHEGRVDAEKHRRRVDGEKVKNTGAA